MGSPWRSSRLAVVAASLVALGSAGCDQISLAVSPREPPSATLVLFDVTGSTAGPRIRERYEAMFLLVLGGVDAIGDDGGVLAADIIDANPKAHATFPLHEVFEACTLWDNALECREERRAQRERALAEVRAILRRSVRGTDVLSGLHLGQVFFQAYPSIQGRNLVVLSDMAQTAGLFRLRGIEDWTEARLVEVVQTLPVVDLSAVSVYVVGAGASVGRVSVRKIDAVEEFWRAYFARTGAVVRFYGPVLPAFPLA